MESVVLENEIIDFKFIRYEKSNVTRTSTFSFEVNLFPNRPFPNQFTKFNLLR